MKDEKTYFLGELSQTWDFVDTFERQREANAINAHFNDLGIDHVTLVDTDRVIVALYEAGQLTLLMPRPVREAGD